MALRAWLLLPLLDDGHENIEGKWICVAVIGSSAM